MYSEVHICTVGVRSFRLGIKVLRVKKIMRPISQSPLSRPFNPSYIYTYIYIYIYIRVGDLDLFLSFSLSLSLSLFLTERSCRDITKSPD